MFEQKFKSIKEINKAYSDHISSLKASDIEFNELDIRKEWTETLINFEQGLDTPPWKQ